MIILPFSIYVHSWVDGDVTDSIYLHSVSDDLTITISLSMDLYLVDRALAIFYICTCNWRSYWALPV